MHCVTKHTNRDIFFCLFFFLQFDQICVRMMNSHNCRQCTQRNVPMAQPFVVQQQRKHITRVNMRWNLVEFSVEFSHTMATRTILSTSECKFYHIWGTFFAWNHTKNRTFLMNFLERAWNLTLLYYWQMSKRRRKKYGGPMSSSKHDYQLFSAI